MPPPLSSRSDHSTTPMCVPATRSTGHHAAGRINPVDRGVMMRNFCNNLWASSEKGVGVSLLAVRPEVKVSVEGWKSVVESRESKGRRAEGGGRGAVGWP
jgi:hypothetical protein